MYVPSATTPDVRTRMQRQRGRDTAPEILLRRELCARGLRGYRLHWPLAFDRRRRADIAWVGRRVAVFVDGCWWHGCPEHYGSPRTNSAWWDAKIERNARRDVDTTERLRAEGWTVVRIWEHETAQDATDRVERALAERPA